MQIFSDYFPECPTITKRFFALLLLMTTFLNGIAKFNEIPRCPFASLRVSARDDTDCQGDRSKAAAI